MFSNQLPRASKNRAQVRRIVSSLGVRSLLLDLAFRGYIKSALTAPGLSFISFKAIYLIKASIFQYIKRNLSLLFLPNPKSDQPDPTRIYKLSTMKTFTISAALALLAALGQAAPAPSQAKGRQFEVQLTFTGAGPNPPIFTLAEPADGSIFEVGESHFSPVKPLAPIPSHSTLSLLFYTSP